MWNGTVGLFLLGLILWLAKTLWCFLPPDIIVGVSHYKILIFGFGCFRFCVKQQLCGILCRAKQFKSNSLFFLG